MPSFINQINALKTAFKPSIKDEPLFKFDGGMVTFDDGNKNVMTTGATDSGKTNNARNGLMQLVANDCPGIVLDVKGDYKDFLLDIAPEKVVVIGATEDCLSINLIGNMSCEKFISFIADEISQLHKEKYWGTGGIRDIEFLFRYLQETKHPTLASLYDMLLNPEKFADFIMRELASREELDEDLINSCDAALKAAFGFFNRGIQKESDNTKLFEQYEWHTAGILSVLRTFSTNALIRNKLSSQKNIDIASLIYDENKIIVLDMPVAQFGSATYTVSRLIRQQFIDAMFSQTSLSLAKKGLGYSKYTFLLIDEYQQFVNISQGKNASGLYDDNLILDKTRQYGHINILATQGVSSLYSQANRDGVASLLQNCRTQIFFSSHDAETLSLVKRLSEDDDIVNAILKPKSRGMAYVYTAHASSKNGAALSGLFRCPKNKWIPSFSETETVNASGDRKIKNPFYKPRPSQRRRVKRISSNRSKVFTNPLVAPLILVSTGELAEKQFFEQYDEQRLGKVMSHQVLRLNPEFSPEELYTWLSCFDLNKGDAVCFIRDKDSKVPVSLFNSEQVIDWSKSAVTKGIHVFCGINHEGGLYEASTKPCRMPGEVAFLVNDLVQDMPF